MTGPLGSVPCKTLLYPIKEVLGFCSADKAVLLAQHPPVCGGALDYMHMSVHFPPVSLTSCVALDELSNFFMFSSL